MLSLTLRPLHSDLSLRFQPESDRPADGFRPARRIIVRAAPFVQPLKQVFIDSAQVYHVMLDCLFA
jgi:hypothetical protein